MIALSYRREDSLPVAGRLYDRLQAHFGKQNVFMDFDSIRPGFDFRDQIKHTIERCEVVVAIIGPRWLGEQSDASRRIDDPSDFVRLEIGYALQRAIPIIPVLINDTPMPKAERLPDDIQGLVYRHALPLDSGLDFHQHADRLISGIAGVVSVPPLPEQPTGSQPPSNPKAPVIASRKNFWVAAAVILLALTAFGGWLALTRPSERGPVNRSDIVQTKPDPPPTVIPLPTSAPALAVPAETAAKPAEHVIKPALELSSVPGGAKVFRNGELIGVTPLRRDDLASGETVLLLVNEGCVPREIKVSIDATRGYKDEVSLTRLAPVYRGDVWVRGDRRIPARPLAITLDPKLSSGTMSQSSKRGDFVVRFSGVWEGTYLRAVTREVVSQPPGIQWTPESFTLHFAGDGNSLAYECSADGKTYTADLLGQPGSGAKTGAIYKGTIRKNGSAAGAGIPLAIVLGADGKSGTQTQSSKYGDTVVKFSGVWEANTLHAVTDEVVSKPKNIQWKPESFTLRFAEDGQTATYECKNEGETFTAQLATP